MNPRESNAVVREYHAVEGDKQKLVRLAEYLVSKGVAA